MIRRVLDALYLVAGWLAGFFLIVVFVLMVVLAVGRGLQLNIPSGDDFAAWSLAAMSFLGLAHTFKSGEMIRVGLLLEHLKGRARWLAEVAALSIGIVVIGYFAYHMGQLARFSWLLNDMSQGVLAVPLWIPQSGVVAGIVILLIAFVDEWIRVIAGRKPSYEKAPPATTEELIERVSQGGV